MQHRADITVVIPMFNREDLIAETLDSVLRQTLPPAAVIVVDDGSTDRSVAAAAKFGDKITLISRKHEGIQAARNAGLEHARTPWLALCDSDDLWQPTWLERIDALRRAAPSVDLVFGNFRILRDGELSRRTKFDDAPPGYWQNAGRRELAEGWVFENYSPGNIFIWDPIFPSALAFSRDLLARAGGFDVRLAERRAEPFEFTLRLLYTAKPAAIPDPVMSLRKHGDNHSSDQLINLIDEIWVHDFVKRTHAAAKPYHAAIDRQILQCRIEAANAAFAAGNHAVTRQMLAQVPWTACPPRLLLKRLVAALPDRAALPANRFLQRIRERKQPAAALE